MSGGDKIGTFFCRTCEDFFEVAGGELPGHGHDPATCPTCQSEALTHCPECGAPVEKNLEKRCLSCSAAYVG